MEGLASASASGAGRGVEEDHHQEAAEEGRRGPAISSMGTEATAERCLRRPKRGALAQVQGTPEQPRAQIPTSPKRQACRPRGREPQGHPTRSEDVGVQDDPSGLSGSLPPSLSVSAPLTVSPVSDLASKPLTRGVTGGVTGRLP